MPMHLDQERLQRLLHGELAGPEEESAREHLAACAECRRHVAEAEREEAEVHALLRAVDHPAPQLGADAIVARAGAPRTAGGGARRTMRPDTWRFELSRVAAAFVALGILGAAAYAAPGSPLRAWVGTMAEWIGGRSAPTPTRPQAPDSRDAGIAVAPGRRLLILFMLPQAEGRAEVSLTDDVEVVVRAPLGAATYTSDVERLLINNEDSSASFEIRIPRAAPRVEIQVHGTRVFLKEGERVTAGESREPQDLPGPYVLPLRR